MNDSGTVVNTYEYTPWGEIRNETETVENPIKYVDPSGEAVVLTCIILGAVVGAVIGGTVGGVASFNKYGNVKWQWVAEYQIGTCLFLHVFVDQNFLIWYNSDKGSD